VDTVFCFLMKLKINGEEKEIADGLSIAALLESLQIRPARVVVELLLGEGDSLEIVHFVGGG